MTGGGRPLGWSEIEAYLVEVGAELERRGLARSIIVVGGAYVAFRGVRASTTDVDTIYELDDELRRVVAIVAERHGLEPDWLNDRARRWRPVTFDPTACEGVLLHRRATSVGPTARRRRAHEDLRRRTKPERRARPQSPLARHPIRRRANRTDFGDVTVDDPGVLADLSDSSEVVVLEQFDGRAVEEAALCLTSHGDLGDCFDQPTATPRDLFDGAAEGDAGDAESSVFRCRRRSR